MGIHDQAIEWGRCRRLGLEECKSRNRRIVRRSGVRPEEAKRVLVYALRLLGNADLGRDRLGLDGLGSFGGFFRTVTKAW